MRLTPHFARAELDPLDCAERDDVLPALATLAAQLEVLRAEICSPIVITPHGGYHPPDAVGWPRRRPTSQHRRGRAADLVVDGVLPHEVAATIRRMIADGRMRQGGVGVYGSFVHYDTRGTVARWKGA